MSQNHFTMVKFSRERRHSHPWMSYYLLRVLVAKPSCLTSKTFPWKSLLLHPPQICKRLNLSSQPSMAIKPIWWTYQRSHSSQPPGYNKQWSCSSQIKKLMCIVNILYKRMTILQLLNKLPKKVAVNLYPPIQLEEPRSCTSNNALNS